MIDEGSGRGPVVLSSRSVPAASDPAHSSPGHGSGAKARCLDTARRTRVRWRASEARLRVRATRIRGGGSCLPLPPWGHPVTATVSATRGDEGFYTQCLALGRRVCRPSIRADSRLPVHDENGETHRQRGLLRHPRRARRRPTRAQLLPGPEVEVLCPAPARGLRPEVAPERVGDADAVLVAVPTPGASRSGWVPSASLERRAFVGSAGQRGLACSEPARGRASSRARRTGAPCEVGRPVGGRPSQFASPLATRVLSLGDRTMSVVAVVLPVPFTRSPGPFCAKSRSLFRSRLGSRSNKPCRASVAQSLYPSIRRGKEEKGSRDRGGEEPGESSACGRAALRSAPRGESAGDLRIQNPELSHARPRASRASPVSRCRAAARFPKL